jgi:hypothetical protein
MPILSDYEMKLLKGVVLKHRIDLLPVTALIGEQPLTTEQLEDFREAIAAEMCETGFTEKDEPNSRGIELETLIDKLWFLSEDGWGKKKEDRLSSK